MQLSSVLDKQNIVFDLTIKTKEELFNNLALNLENNGFITSARRFIKDLKKREKEASTGIEDGFGIPHAKSKAVVKPTIAFAHVDELSDYLALDESRVECVFMIAVPDQDNVTHLELLSFLARKLMDDQFKASIKMAKDAEEIRSILTSLGGE
ncbi:PTS sugar transporter subunit IIA [Amphibacillus cookii]|uniref:PTS sugar transporter subunit IIA n=1 Tax=Amphibacillus cookii TaxID=767787 RepID=UPI00195BBDF3|nr:fructose PTS transporter subunit IIA [Amphibacillus cookii]MBM7541211.1 fructose-specific phosphotransferase system IIA component [Amphibacillus cookii]